MKARRPERPARLPDYSEDCLRALVKSGLTTPGECWNLWRKREELAGSDATRRRARLAIATHLGRIVQHRRLEDIADPEARCSLLNLNRASQPKRSRHNDAFQEFGNV